ncbi:nucleotide-diphospho-sugar transferase [Auriculariales sp. MPI-PUGE-AT-0066]|nr:nucleotide-diphospho-sugar transferase [Auriculariales sp. MPI-PUGE-AT-0066]
MAFVTLLTQSSYTAATLVLNHTLRLSGSRFRLYVMVSSSLPAQDRAILRRAGIRMLEVKDLRPPLSKWHPNPADARFADTWLKLRAFDLVQFSRVVLLDADMVLRANIDELMTKPLEPGWIAACPVCACNPEKRPHYPPDWKPANCPYTPLNHPEAATAAMPITPNSPAPYRLLNSGNVVLTPRREDAERIQSLIATSDMVSKFQFPDQDLLSHLFKSKWQPLPYVYNGIKPSRIHHAHMWRDEEVKVVHYVLPDKPWHRREWGNNPYATLYQWWWDAYDMVRDEMLLKNPTFAAQDLAYLEHHMSPRA